MRTIPEPRVEFTQDHILVELDRMTKLVTVAGTFTVPYSTIQQAEVGEPKIPGIMDQWLHGLHMPGVVAKGRFLGWRGERRFLWIERNSTRALKLRLVGHPQYDEIVLSSAEADAWLARLEAARKGGKW